MKRKVETRMALPFERSYNDVELYGARVKELRKGENRTCRDVANNIGISHSIITKIENGSQKRINLKHLELLSEYFTCSYMSLLGKSDSRTYYKDNILYLNPDDRIYLEDILHQTGYLTTDQTIDSVGGIVLDKIIRRYADEEKNGKFRIQYERDSCLNVRATSITRIAKDNSYGVRVTLEGGHKIYFYYFKKRNFKVDLTSQERTIADVGELEKKRDSKYIIQQIAARKDFEDVLVVQECRNLDYPALFKDKSRNTTHRYHMMLQKIFYKHNSFDVKNIPIIELLYAMPHYRDNEIIKLLVRILRMDEFYGKHSEKNKYGEVTRLMSDYLQLFLDLDYEYLKYCYEEIIMKNKDKKKRRG